MSIVKKLTDANLITPPGFLPDNVCYETITGSVAYGVSTDTSDVDVYGYCIPPKHDVFPHLAGNIVGFGKPYKRFEQYQKHHIKCPSEVGKEKEYDIVIYSIVKYFNLCMDSNPNMVDSMFSPRDCILTSSPIHEMVREKRHLFLSKAAWPKYKGYSYSQLHKMSNKEPIGKRVATVEKYGYDVKFAYHLVRLLYEAEQILQHRDIDLRLHREHLKAIRRGDFTEQDIREWAAAKEVDLERVYANSTIPLTPDYDAIRTLLLNCLEHHYGNLSEVIVTEDRATQALREVAAIIERSGV